ncbi:MAG: nucleotidyl transferase AbiEii/AbiGii toxin family protein [Chloroflexota bacterium]|nr:nucleotidyl transferase AbiEii/AbiGii toxin family protein [Chloroflexota bacterium]
MAFDDVYRDQVALLIRTLPYVAAEDCLALKGGTAINLFHREMPRLSVDVDLTYLPVADREESLRDIDRSLRRVSEQIQEADPSAQITESAPASQNTIDKLFVRSQGAQIKIEVNPVLRGCVNEPELMEICAKAEEQFGYAQNNVMSFADLFAGKIAAALDRQHPRDLFDVHQLLENEGITDALRETLIVYLIGHQRSPAQLLTAQCRNIEEEYRTAFYGMTEDDVSMETLVSTHADLTRNLVNNMSDAHRRFLASFYRRRPEWDLLGVDGVDRLPAVRWREINLDRAGKETQEAMARHMEEVLG